MQPFIDQNQNVYISTVWPELAIHNKGDHLFLTCQEELETVSSAVYGGGIQTASHFVNWQVHKGFDCSDPVETMKRKLEEWSYPPGKTIGLQTAAWVHHASVHEEQGDEFRLVCCVTAGLGNRERAGIRRQAYSSYQAGTINTLLLLDSRIAQAAMINGIMTAAEAKAAALQDSQVTLDTGEFATGTTTDSIVLACSQNPRYPLHLFAGTATTIGNAIGCLVYEATSEAIRNLEG